MVVSVDTLKQYFQNGSKPTQEQFADLIDTLSLCEFELSKSQIDTLNLISEKLISLNFSEINKNTEQINVLIYRIQIIV